MANIGRNHPVVGFLLFRDFQGARSFCVLVGPKRGESNIAHEVRNRRIPPFSLLKVGERVSVLFLARLRSPQIVIGVAQDHGQSLLCGSDVCFLLRSELRRRLARLRAGIDYRRGRDGRRRCHAGAHRAHCFRRRAVGAADLLGLLLHVGEDLGVLGRFFFAISLIADASKHVIGAPDLVIVAGVIVARQCNRLAQELFGLGIVVTRKSVQPHVQIGFGPVGLVACRGLR